MLYSAIQIIIDGAGGITGPVEKNDSSWFALLLMIGICVIIVGVIIAIVAHYGNKRDKLIKENKKQKCELCEKEYIKPIERNVNLCDDCYRLYKAGGLVQCKKCGSWHVPNVKCECEKQLDK